MLNFHDNNSLSREYWDCLGESYSNVWKSKAKKELSKRELNFIGYYVKKKNFINLLDIGSGNGRIIEYYIKNTSLSTKIFGIDMSPEMVSFCKRKFAKKRKIKDIKVCNIGHEPLCYDSSFDFISAIRVLKYNENWREIIMCVSDKIKKNGIFIFSMPNVNSISAFHKDTFSSHGLPISYTTNKELKKTLRENNFEILQIRAFSKAPNFLYDLADSYLYAKFLVFIERLLEVILGKSFLGRELFVVCLKK